MKSGNPNFLEPSGPLQACNGTDLLTEDSYSHGLKDTCTHFLVKETVSVCNTWLGINGIFIPLGVADGGGPILESLQAHQSLCLQLQYSLLCCVSFLNLDASLQLFALHDAKCFALELSTILLECLNFVVSLSE